MGRIRTLLASWLSRKLVAKGLKPLEPTKDMFLGLHAAMLAFFDRMWLVAADGAHAEDIVMGAGDVGANAGAGKAEEEEGSGHGGGAHEADLHVAAGPPSRRAAFSGSAADPLDGGMPAGEEERGMGGGAPEVPEATGLQHVLPGPSSLPRGPEPSALILCGNRLNLKTMFKAILATLERII